MGYKLLGYVVWKGAKWYLGRRVGSPPGRTKAMLAGGALLLGAGAIVILGRSAAKD
jgi:hypothetical protein